VLSACLASAAVSAAVAQRGRGNGGEEVERAFGPESQNGLPGPATPGAIAEGPTSEAVQSVAQQAAAADDTHGARPELPEAGQAGESSVLREIGDGPL